MGSLPNSFMFLINASDMIKNMKLFGSDPKGLYDLDREYQTRVFVAPTMPM